MQDLYAIAEAKLADELEGLYKQEFQKKYKTQPLIQDIDRVTFRWCASQFDGKKARGIINTYFKLNDKFILGKCHPAALIKSNITAVIASLGHSFDGGGSQPQGMHITTSVGCDKCHQRFDWIGPADELGSSKWLCGNCRGGGSVLLVSRPLERE